MKKIIFAVILLGLLGFTVWVVSPTQQVQRKTKRVLKIYTVDKEAGESGSTSDALFFDSLFTENVSISASGNAASKFSYLNRGSVSRDNLTTAHHHMRSHLNQFTHELGDMTVNKVKQDHYSVTFPHTINVQGKGKLSLVKTVIESTTTFHLKKDEGKLKVYKIEFK